MSKFTTRNHLRFENSDFTPLSSDFRTLIVKDSSTDKNAVAFHGTSGVAVAKLKRTGYLPAGVLNKRLFFFPVPDTNLNFSGPNTKAGVLRAANNYADEITVKTLLPKYFNLPINSQSITFCYQLYSDSNMLGVNEAFKENPQMSSYFKANGITPLIARRVLNLFNHNNPFKYYKGCTIGFKNSLLTDFQIYKPRNRDDGLYVIASQGISIKHISSICPLSINDYARICGD